MNVYFVGVEGDDDTCNEAALGDEEEVIDAINDMGWGRRDRRCAFNPEDCETIVVRVKNMTQSRAKSAESISFAAKITLASTGNKKQHLTFLNNHLPGDALHNKSCVCKSSQSIERHACIQLFAITTTQCHVIAPPCKSANLVECALLRPRHTGRWRHTTADNRITHGCKGVSWKIHVSVYSS
jgi:hypothetical protein